MRSRFVPALLMSLGLGLLLNLGIEGADPVPPPDAEDAGVVDAAAVAQADDLPEPQPGVQPLGKGPVHEAYAAPGAAAVPKPGPLIPKEPPQPVEELPPAQKPEGDNVQWIPGYWAWDEESQDYLWVSGIWRNVPPGRRWVPGRYHRAVGGWQWVPGFWAVEDQQDLPVLPVPPERIPEAEPPRPREDAVFIPGNWVWVEYRYVWRPGFWCVYRPGWVWVPAHYVWTPCGFVYVEGYWDYPLHCRGLLFAPCRIDRAVVFAPGVRFVYTPCYVINDRCLMTALFVHPHCGWYCFGDYFDVTWRSRGYVSWVHFRIGRCYDPLFGFYRVHHIHYCRNPIWERDLCGLYEARFIGTAPRPPVTLVQQNTIINQVRVKKEVNVTQINNVTMLAPVTKVNEKVVKLEKLDADRLEKERNSAERIAQLARQREKQEATLLAKSDGGNKSAEPKRIKLDAPPVRAADKDKPVGESAKRAAPPPPPVPVKPEEIIKQAGSAKNDSKKGDTEKKGLGEATRIPNAGSSGIVDRKANPTDDKPKSGKPLGDASRDAKPENKAQSDKGLGNKPLQDKPSDRVPRIGSDTGSNKGPDVPKSNKGSSGTGGISNPNPSNPGSGSGTQPKRFDPPKSGGGNSPLVPNQGSSGPSAPKSGGGSGSTAPKIGDSSSPNVPKSGGSNNPVAPRSGGSIKPNVPNVGGGSGKPSVGGGIPRSGGGGGNKSGDKKNK
ncbi:MAG: hypothetical protein NZM31_00415 [Gemmatales bacterium]|nr:hypothetical protein [Gemmatales bacterium]MDW8385456.1 hypothetical protein [Gemmatales bacterium]